MKKGGTCFFWPEPPGHRFFATDPDLENGPDGLNNIFGHITIPFVAGVFLQLRRVLKCILYGKIYEKDVANYSPLVITQPKKVSGRPVSSGIRGRKIQRKATKLFKYRKKMILFNL